MVISLMRNLRSINLIAVVSIFVATSLRSTIVFGQYASTPPSTTTAASTSSGGSSYTSGWLDAHATFYGDESARETMGGACGYGNLFDNGYGTATAALSSVLFNNGKVCGSCYQLKCVNSKWCFSGAAPITITATNLCPPNWYQASDNGGWCNPPRSHFDLSKPIFMKFAQWTAGIVPVQYRRVPCQRQGGIRFKFSGNRDWLLVSVMNVGGPGDVGQLWVKGTKTSWISMSRNWGASFQAFSRLGGQALCFKVQSASGQIALAYTVAPSTWTAGHTYQATVNFH